MGNSSFMVTLTIVPRHKPKWSQDKFNGQSHIFKVARDDVMIHHVNNPLISHHIEESGRLCTVTQGYHIQVYLSSIQHKT